MNRIPARFFPLALGLALAVRLSAQDQTINGNLTVNGWIGATGAIDSDANQFSFGSQSGGVGSTFLYADDALPGGANDTFRYSLNRISASWLWLHAPSVANSTGKVMRLDASHQLTLFKDNGSTVGVSLVPAANPQLILGSATLTNDAPGKLSTSGAFAVGGNFSFSGTDGEVTTNSSGMTLTAGSGDKSIALSASGTGDLVFSAGGFERARIKSTGNVGIGTSIPGYRLDLRTPGGFASQLHVASTNTDAGGYWVTTADSNFYASAGAAFSGTNWMAKATSYGVFGSGNGAIQFFTGTGVTPGTALDLVERMRVDPVGNVGIGTNSPAAKLDVRGDIRSYRDGADSITPQIYFGNPAITRAWNWQLTASGESALWGYDGSVWAEKLRVGLSGNVGLGTTNPDARLHIGIDGVSTPGLKVGSGTNAQGWYAFLGNDTSAATTAYVGNAYNHDSAAFQIRMKGTAPANAKVTVLGNGNVGIDAAAPLDRLQINSIRPIIMGRNGSAGIYGSHIGFNTTIDTHSVPNTITKLGGTGQFGGAIITVDYTGNYQLQTYNAATENASTVNHSPQFTFSNEGRLGIGTANPQRALEIGLGDVPGIGFERYTSGPDSGALRFGDGTGWKFHIGRSRNVSGGPLNSGTSGILVTFQDNGNVGIGTTNPGIYKLAVLGKIRAQEIVVDTGWADYVFDESYRLAPLSEVEAHIHAKKHLPGIPSAAEVAEHGVSMGDMQSKLLSKVEELTLHLIAQQKLISAQAERLDRLEGENRRLRNEAAGE